MRTKYSPARTSYIIPLIMFLYKCFQLTSYPSLGSTPVNHILILTLLGLVTVISWSTAVIVEAINSIGEKQ